MSQLNPRWRSRASGFSLVFALLLPEVVLANEPRCPELPCSVIRNCSSTGVACAASDRACLELARSRDLEVKCEQVCDDGPVLVYCPPDTGRSDSRVVWVLLAAAFGVAIVGGGILWLVVRGKRS